MEQLKTPKDRLLAYMSEKKITPTALQNAIGAANGFLNNNSGEFKTDTIRKISQIYTDLNITWLIFGTGTMSACAEEGNIEHMKYVAQLEARVDEQAETIADLREMLRMKKDYPAQQPMAAVG